MPYLGVLAFAAGGGIAVHWWLDGGPASKAATAGLLMALGVVLGVAA